MPLDTDKAHKDPSWVDLHRHHLAPFTSEIWCGSMIDPNNIFLTFCSLPKFQEARKTWNSWWFRDDPCLLREGSQCLFFLRGWTVKFWEGIVSLPIVGDKTEASHTSMKKNPPQFSSRMVAFERIDKNIWNYHLNYGFVEVGGKHIATSGPSKMVVSQWCRWGNVVGAARAICRYRWEYRTKRSKKSQVLLWVHAMLPPGHHIATHFAQGYVIQWRYHPTSCSSNCLSNSWT